jgi:hypothetical protein
MQSVVVPTSAHKTRRNGAPPVGWCLGDQMRVANRTVGRVGLRLTVWDRGAESFRNILRIRSKITEVVEP